jgi:predicted nucleotidyltransferase
MKVVGLITEYNPFHNGHKYHIEQAKEITGADYCVAVMSGNFVQRGTPAVMDKYSRAKMALNNGVDLVLELPVCYATGSAEYFAHGAISILDKLGVVNTLCFGSECGNISLLTSAAQFLLHAPEAFENQLQDYMREGLTYPAARLKALEHSMCDTNTTCYQRTANLCGSTNLPIDKSMICQSNFSDRQSLSKILTEPNNILGIEYSKALIKFSSSIEPITIQRISAHYHERELSEAKPYDSNDLELCDPVISSATAIRNSINQQREISADSLTAAAQSVPEDVAKYLKDHYHITYPITEEDFAQILKYKLCQEDSSSLANYLDITSDLAERLKNIKDFNMKINSLIQEIKTRNMTLTRINRALIHVLLNIKTDTMNKYIEADYTPYARILGIRKESTPLLRSIEKHGRIPMITKVSKAEGQLDALGMQMLSEDIFAANIYNQAVYQKYGTTLLNEYKHGICMV